MTDDPMLAAFIAGDDEGMGALNHKMGVKIVEASAERVVATMPVEGNTQPYGLLHGGASVVLAESLGSLGSAIHAHPDRISVGVDINATHHRAATGGLVTGVATPAAPRAQHGVRTRSSSPTSRTGGCAPAGSPAPCSRRTGAGARASCPRRCATRSARGAGCGVRRAPG